MKKHLGKPPTFLDKLKYEVTSANFWLIFVSIMFTNMAIAFLYYAQAESSEDSQNKTRQLKGTLEYYSLQIARLTSEVKALRHVIEKE